jgi:uncharacterized protein
MPTNVLVDAGPLVAWLNADDEHHSWARQQFEHLRPPLFTCEAAIMEAAFLLTGPRLDPTAVVTLISRGVLQVSFALQTESEVVADLMRRYRNVPMSMADACLVRMSEIYENCAVLTTDSDFMIYRRFGRRSIPTVLPTIAT